MSGESLLISPPLPMAALGHPVARGLADDELEITALSTTWPCRQGAAALLPELLAFASHHPLGAERVKSSAAVLMEAAAERIRVSHVAALTGWLDRDGRAAARDVLRSGVDAAIDYAY